MIVAMMKKPIVAIHLTIRLWIKKNNRGLKLREGLYFVLSINWTLKALYDNISYS